MIANHSTRKKCSITLTPSKKKTSLIPKCLMFWFLQSMHENSKRAPTEGETVSSSQNSMNALEQTKLEMERGTEDDK